jgi:hypothetical protein
MNDEGPQMEEEINFVLQQLDSEVQFLENMLEKAIKEEDYLAAYQYRITFFQKTDTLRKFRNLNFAHEDEIGILELKIVFAEISLKNYRPPVKGDWIVLGASRRTYESIEEELKQLKDRLQFLQNLKPKALNPDNNPIQDHLEKLLDQSIRTFRIGFEDSELKIQFLWEAANGLKIKFWVSEDQIEEKQARMGAFGYTSFIAHYQKNFKDFPIKSIPLIISEISRLLVDLYDKEVDLKKAILSIS